MDRTYVCNLELHKSELMVRFRGGFICSVCFVLMCFSSLLLLVRREDCTS